MPIMNGFEFLEEFSKIRVKLNIYNSLVLTMLSSSRIQEEKEKALSYDFVKGYITKMPDSAEELKGIVQKYFPDFS
jgi:CheY-like chemotaxis protein